MNIASDMFSYFSNWWAKEKVENKEENTKNLTSDLNSLNTEELMAKLFEIKKRIDPSFVPYKCTLKLLQPQYDFASNKKDDFGGGGAIKCNVNFNPIDKAKTLFSNTVNSVNNTPTQAANTVVFTRVIVVINIRTVSAK